MKKILIISIIGAILVFLMTSYPRYKDLVSHQPVYDASGAIINKDFTSNPPSYALVTSIPNGVFSFIVLFGLLYIFNKKKINTNNLSNPPGVELRRMLLTGKASDFSIQTIAESSIFAVCMDFVLETDNVVSVVALSDGNASLYTNSSSNLIGGYSHESVNVIAKEFISIAQKNVNDGEVVTEFPYPKGQEVYYYLVSNGGVRRIKTDISSDNYKDLFDLGQKVIYELRSTPAGKEMFN